MELYSMQQTESNHKVSALPRVNKQFIGLSHQLQNKKKQRRKVSQQQRSIENRVLYLQKQQYKVKKDLKQKRSKLLKIVMTKQRQENQSLEKQALRKSRQQELQRLKKHNQYMKLIHKSNKNHAISNLQKRNKSDYQKAKQQLLMGESYKRQYKMLDLTQKRDHYIDLRISQEKAKIKIDQFFKRKNNEHIQNYKSKMENQEQKALDKIKSIRRLETQEQELRAKVEHATLRSSRMQDLIMKVSKTIDVGNNRKNYEPTTLQGSYTQRNSASGKLRDNQIQQNLENYSIDQMQKELKFIRKRRKNKHSNRYKQYEQF